MYMKQSILREKRESLGMTQATLARRAGLSPGTIDKIENSRNSPKLETLAKLANGLGENLADIIDEMQDCSEVLDEVFTEWCRDGDTRPVRGFATWTGRMWEETIKHLIFDIEALVHPISEMCIRRPEPIELPRGGVIAWLEAHREQLLETVLFDLEEPYHYIQIKDLDDRLWRVPTAVEILSRLKKTKSRVYLVRRDDIIKLKVLQRRLGGHKRAFDSASPEEAAQRGWTTL